jgi:hypothetical protein
VAELTERLTSDAKRLVSTEYALVLAEVDAKIARARAIAIAVGAALVCVWLGMLGLLATLIVALAQWVPAWAAAGIPTAVLLLLGGGLGLRARSVIQQLNAMPQRSVHSVKVHSVKRVSGGSTTNGAPTRAGDQ